MIQRSAIPNYLSNGGLNDDQEDWLDYLDDKDDDKDKEEEDDYGLALPSPQQKQPVPTPNDRNSSSDNHRLEQLYAQIDQQDKTPNEKGFNWQGLMFDAAKLMAPSAESQKFITDLENRRAAPAAAAQKRLLKKIELAKVLDESKRKAYEFEREYEQKDRAIDAKYKKNASAQQVPIDPETGLPFESKQAYVEYLKGKRHLKQKDDDHYHEYVKKHSDVGVKLAKQKATADRIMSNLDNFDVTLGKGKLSEAALAVQSWVNSDASTLSKDLGELAAMEEVADVGSRSSNAMMKFYQTIKPSVGESKQTIKQKLELRKKAADLMLSVPERLKELRAQGMSTDDARSSIDAQIAKELASLTPTKNSSKRPSIEEMRAALKARAASRRQYEQ